MELRPRKGRPTPAPSTPCSVSKPASRSSSSSRKKQEPSTPILVLSDNDGDQHDERKETGISDMTLPANPGYSTPLSSVAKSHRARTSTRKSNAKQRVKVMSPVTANLEKSRDKSVASQGVDGETCTESLSLERTACMKNVPENAVSEVLSENLVVSTSSKKPHSTRKKKKDRGKFSDNKQDGVGIHERIDDRSKQNCDQERLIDDHDEGQGMLSLVLSEEETAEVSDSMNMGGLTASITKASSDSEAEPVHTEVSGGSIKRRNPSLIEEVVHEEALCHFEGKTGITRSTALNVESEAYSKLETKGVLILREEACRPSEGNAQEDVEERIRNFGGHEGTSLKEGFSKSKVSDSDLVARDEAKFGVTGATGTRDENEQRNVHETSLIALNEVSNAISGHQGNRDNSTHGFSSDVTKATVMLTDEGDNFEDDESSSSSGDDEGDDEDELASVLVKSMKLHLHNSIESCYGLNKQQEYQAKEGEVFRAETGIQKAAASGINGKNKSLGHGLSWSPDTGLPTSITSPTLTGKAKGIQNGVPEKIWHKDGCLQDGLLVPPVDPHKLNKLARKQKRDTKGEKWFNMCASTITPELQKELQLVKLRGVLDPKRHYKAEDTKGLPKYFQVGTVVGGPADFYSGRLTKKEQKGSLADELLSNSSLTAYRKRKYLEIQDQKQAGGKGFWKQKKSKRTPAWAKI